MQEDPVNQETTEEQPDTQEVVSPEAQQTGEEIPQDGTYQSENAEENPSTVIVDLMRTEETIVLTGKGKIHVIHEITLGDVVISILLTCILVFMVLNRFIGRR